MTFELSSRRWLVSLAGALAVLSVSGSSIRGLQPQSTAPSPAAAAPQRASLDRYCVGCHNDRAKTGGLALDTLDVEHVGESAEAWEKVVRKLRGRMMPPPGRPRPDEATYESLVSYLETSLDRSAAVHPNPGRTDTFRRLNRTEYQNAIRDLLALDVDVSALLPKDDVSHGFDNVGVGELSPTLLERYLAAAQKVSRLAVGSSAPSPASHVVVLPADLTQEDHVDGLPFGTRGGALVRHTFPLDGAYEIQIRLSRDRNENVEGLSEPSQLEITLDGNRLQLFTIKPNRNQSGAYYADEAVDKDLKVRVPVPAGPHELGVTFPRKTSALPETERQPYQAHFNMDRHPRIQPAVYSVSIAGPFDAAGSADTPSRQRLFVCRPPSQGASAAAEAACAKTIVSTLARRAYRRPVTASDLEAPLEFYQAARSAGGFDAGIEMAVRAILASTEFLFRIERDPPNAAPDTAYRVSDLELASRLSFFLWSSIPDEELLGAGRRRETARAAGAGTPGEADAGRPSRGSAGHELRRPMAVPPQPGGGEPGRADVPGLRRQPPAGLPARNGTVRRQHRDGGPQRPGPAAGELHVRQRAAGQALWHSQRVWQPLPPRHPRRGQRPRRTARSRQHSHGDVVREPHVARAARQVDPGKHPRNSPAAATAERAAAAGHQRGRQGAVDAGADGATPGECRLLRLPSADGSRRPVDGALRCHRAMAQPHRGGLSRRCVGRSARRIHVRRHGRSSPRAVAASGIVRVDGHRAADDLRAGQGRRVLRCAGGSRHYPGCTRERLPVLVAGSRHREQSRRFR